MEIEAAEYEYLGFGLCEVVSRSGQGTPNREFATRHRKRAANGILVADGEGHRRGLIKTYDEERCAGACRKKLRQRT